MNRLYGALVCAFVAVTLLVASTAAAQPYDTVFSVTSGHRYIAVAHDPAGDLDFDTGFTFEAWVNVADGGGCSSIAALFQLPVGLRAGADRHLYVCDLSVTARRGTIRLPIRRDGSSRYWSMKAQ